MHHVTDDLAKFQAVVGLDEQERMRMMLTTFLLPISIACGNAAMSNDPGLMKLTGDARNIYLGRMTDKATVVRCGDYVVWRVDRNNVFRMLREQLSLLKGDSELLDYQIPYGVLVLAIVTSRCDTYCSDVRMMLEKAPRGDFQAMSEFLYKGMSASFNRQIIEFDPMNPSMNEAAIERFQIGFAYGIPVVGGLHQRVTSILKG